MTSYAFDFWGSLTHQPELVQLARDLKAAGHPVHVISWVANAKAEATTRRLIAELGIEFDTVNVGRFPAKSEIMTSIGADVLIDDSQSVCDEVWRSGLGCIHAIAKDHWERAGEHCVLAVINGIPITKGDVVNLQEAR